MALPDGYALDEARTLIRQRWDLLNDTGWITDAELNDMILESLEALWDALHVIFKEDFLWVEDTIAVNADSSGAYDLPGDFWRLRSLDIEHNGGVRYPLRRFNRTGDPIDTVSYSWPTGADIQYELDWRGRLSGNASNTSYAGPSHVYFYPPPDTAQTVNITYHPRPVTIDTDPTNAIVTFGYDEFLVLDCGRKIFHKRGVDVASVVQDLERYRQRIERDAPPVDRGQAPTIADLSWRDHFDGRTNFFRNRYR